MCPRPQCNFGERKELGQGSTRGIRYFLEKASEELNVVSNSASGHQRRSSNALSRRWRSMQTQIALRNPPSFQYVLFLWLQDLHGGAKTFLFWELWRRHGGSSHSSANSFVLLACSIIAIAVILPGSVSFGCVQPDRNISVGTKHGFHRLELGDPITR